jgi:hypothetical protein
MKTRSGFVSNSSSTSFLVTTDADKEFCIQCHIHLYSIDDILDAMEEVMQNSNIPDFIKRDLFSRYDWDLRDIQKQYPGKTVYITDTIDRDWASEMGFNMEEFEGDL